MRIKRTMPHPITESRSLAEPWTLCDTVHSIGSKRAGVCYLLVADDGRWCIAVVKSRPGHCAMVWFEGSSFISGDMYELRRKVGAEFVAWTNGERLSKVLNTIAVFLAIDMSHLLVTYRHGMRQEVEQ